MKNYNLDEIEYDFRKIKEFLDGLACAWKIQGVDIPDRLKDVRDIVQKQIVKIGGKENE